MCSVNGCIIFKKERSEEEIEEIEKKVREIIVKAEDRGRDSYGIISVNRKGEIIEIKDLGKPSDSLNSKPKFVFSDTTIVINNNRAEPTTEFVPLKLKKDIQPFRGSRIIVSHNGIIANDRILEEKYNLKRESKIDSSIIPPLLEKLWDGSLEGLRDILVKEIVGSFALALVDLKDPERLYLACNYKPLFLEYDGKLDTLFFTSLENYLREDKVIWESNPIRQLEPYSLITVTTHKKYDKLSLWMNTKRKERALVVCSAGLDSTVCAKLMIDRGYDVTLLHFKYRHRAEKREAEQVAKIAEYLNCKLYYVDTDLFKNVIGHSKLTNTEEEVAKNEEGVEFAHEWVPARNLIFLSIAVGIAEAYGYDVVVLGANLEEAGSYPDNEQIFIYKLNEVLPYACNYQKKVRIEMPVGNLMKHEIVKLGLEIKAPLHLTWSCYEGGEKHCGLCGPCYMRRRAFEMNGLKDFIDYEFTSSEKKLSLLQDHEA